MIPEGLCTACSATQLCAEHAHPEPVQGDPLSEYHKQDCNRYINGFCGTIRCLKRGGWTKGSAVSYEVATCEAHETVLKLAELGRALEEMTLVESQSGRYVLGKIREWRERAEAAERDLAALRQERDDWRQAFEAANEAIGTMEASHAQALQRARVEYRTFFEAGWSRGFQEALTEDTRPWEDRCEAELTAYLASRKG